MADKAKQIATITELRDDYDHCFLTEAGANHFGEPFGFVPRCSRHFANPEEPKGLTLEDGAESAIGIAADDLAAQIATALGVQWASWKMGRGSRLRDACNAILAHIEETQ